MLNNDRFIYCAMSSDTFDEYISMKKAAQMLGVSRQRIHQILKEQKVEKHYLHERAVLIPRTWIDAELQRGERSPPSSILEERNIGTQNDYHNEIWEVLCAFFKTEHVQKSLLIIENHDIYDWKRWWQIELATHLSELDNIDEWHIGNQITLFDIGFCLKHHNKNVWHFVQLVQDNDYKKCIDKLFRDIERVFAADPETLSLKGRKGCIAFAGVFHTKDYKNILKYVDRQLKLLGHQLESMPIYLETVSDHHSLLVI